MVSGPTTRGRWASGMSALGGGGGGGTAVGLCDPRGASASISQPGGIRCGGADAKGGTTVCALRASGDHGLWGMSEPGSVVEWELPSITDRISVAGLALGRVSFSLPYIANARPSTTTIPFSASSPAGLSGTRALGALRLNRPRVAISKATTMTRMSNRIPMNQPPPPDTR